MIQILLIKNMMKSFECRFNHKYFVAILDIHSISNQNSFGMNNECCWSPDNYF